MKMTNARINILWQQKAVCLLVAAITLSSSAQAQLSLKRQKYDSIATRYKKEHAVYTEVKQQMRIKLVDGEMLGENSVIREKLFISDKSLNTFNSDPVHGANYSYFTQYATIAYLPEGNDYKMVQNTDRNGNTQARYSGITKKTITRTVYTQELEEIRLLPRMEMGNSIPTLSSVVEVIAPRYVKMGFLLKGEDTSRIKRTIVEDGANIIYRFTGLELPAEKEYTNVPSDLYYITHVTPYVVSFRLPGAKKDSVLSGSLDVHHKFEYNFVKGLNYKTDSFLNKKVAELTKYAYSDKDKVAKIYEWVQSNFHYEALFISDFEGFVPNPADTVCKRMYGDCKDMSSIISAMCQKAGVPTYFAVIGTNDKPYTHEELQTQHLYNHMICAVKLGGEWYFPDGTTRILPLGANRWDIQGKEAMIMLDKSDYKIVKIPEEPASKSVVTRNTTMNLSYDDVTGTINDNYTGYAAWGIGDALAYRNRKEDRDDFIRDILIEGNNKFLIKNYSVNASKTGNKDVSINAQYTLGGYVQQIKKEYFVNMHLNNPFLNLLVNDTDRHVAVYLPYKKTIRETTTLNVPKGYRVSYLPKGSTGGINGLWNYTISYKNDRKNNTVILTTEYTLHTMKIAPSEFEANNKLVEKLKTQYKETVVLTAK